MRLFLLLFLLSTGALAQVTTPVYITDSKGHANSTAYPTTIRGSLAVGVDPNSSTATINGFLSVLPAYVDTIDPTYTGGTLQLLSVDGAGGLRIRGGGTLNAVTPPEAAILAGGLVTTAAPSYTDATMNGLSLTGTGALRVDCTNGCSGGASTPTDAFANPTTASLSQSFGMVWNGATWDRTPGSTAGVKVIGTITNDHLSTAVGSGLMVFPAVSMTLPTALVTSNDNIPEALHIDRANGALHVQLLGGSGGITSARVNAHNTTAIASAPYAGAVEVLPAAARSAVSAATAGRGTMLSTDSTNGSLNVRLADASTYLGAQVVANNATALGNVLTVGPATFRSAVSAGTAGRVGSLSMDSTNGGLNVRLMDSATYLSPSVTANDATAIASQLGVQPAVAVATKTAVTVGRGEMLQVRASDGSLFVTNDATGTIGAAAPSVATYIGALTSGGTNMGALNLDASGYLKVNVAAGGASGGTSSSYGAAFPATGTAIGATDGVNMVALSVDGSGYLKTNCVTGCAGGASTPAENFANPTTAGLSMGFSMVWDGVAWDRMPGDSTNGVKVFGGLTINNAAPAAANNLGVLPAVSRTARTAVTQDRMQLLQIATEGNGGDGSLYVYDTASSQPGATYATGGPAGGALWGQVAMGSVTTAAPSYTNGTGNSLSLTTAGALRVDGSAVTQPVSGTFWQATQPVSGTVTANIGTVGTLATEATLSAASAKLPATLGQKAMAASMAVVLASDQAAIPVTLTSTTITGTVAATQSGTWNVNNVSGTVSLPTGASTAAKQPALGTAGTASADVITVQGIASMTALKVDGSAVTQPVSGTFWQATQPVSGTVSVTGVATETSLAKLTIAQGTALGANTVALMGGSVTTAAPTYTNGQISPLNLDTSGQLRVVLPAGGSGLTDTELRATAVPVSLTSTTVTGTVAVTQSGAWSLSANQSVNIAQINGVATTMGNGVSGTGVQRVTIASDSTGVVGLATGTNTIGSVKLTDGTDTALISASGELSVNCTTGCAGGATTPADNFATPTTAGLSASFGMVYDGATWDMVRGTAADGLLVNLGANNDVTASQTGTWNITDISGTVSLPTGAATAAKQPALGTAGTASSDVITVQGIASMTALKVDGSAVTQPVSGTVSITANSAVNVAQINGVATSMGNGASGTGVQRVTIANDSTGIIALTTSSAQIGHLEANQSVNTAQINGVTVLMGAGNTGTGSQRVTIASDNAPITVQGAAADDAAISGSPVPVGAKAIADASAPSAVTAGDVAYLVSTLERRLLVTDEHPNRFHASSGLTTATTSTTLQTAPGASKSLYITDVTMSGSAAATTTTDQQLILKQGSDANCASNITLLYACFNPATGGCSHTFKQPIKLTANYYLCFMSAVAGSKYFMVEGFTAP